MKFDGNGLFVQANDQDLNRPPTYYKIDAASAELPSTFEIAIGLSYLQSFDEENSLLQSSGLFQNNNYAYDDYKFGLQSIDTKIYYL